MDSTHRLDDALRWLRRPAAPAVLLGGAMLAGALVVVAGWLARNRTLVHLLPGEPMTFNTALSFALAGIGLLCYAAPATARRRAQSALGAAIAALASLVLAQYLSGRTFGFDWPGLHLWLLDASPFPGRMAVMTSATFVFVGALFVLMNVLKPGVRWPVAHALAALVAASGVFALAGYALDLRDLFENYWFAQVSLTTALGFALLPPALWLAWRAEPWNQQVRAKTPDERIVFTVGLVLATAIVVAVLAGFRVLQTGVETTLSREMAFALKSRKDLVSSVIERDIKQAADMARLANVVELFARHARNPADARPRAALQAVAENALRFGFASVALRDAQGHEIASAGTPLASSELRLELAHLHRATLMWDGQLLLQTDVDVRDGDVRLGTLRAQHRMPELRDLMLGAADLQQTSEILMCGSRGALLHCAPTRFHPLPHDAERIVRGAPRPMSLALAGLTGVMKTVDDRGRRVLAAYSLMARLGLGLVLKTDLVELYAPLRQQLGYMAAVLALLLGAGIWLLLWRVRPIAARLATSELRLRLALQASGLTFWDWDVRTGRIHLSEHWQLLLGGEPGPLETTVEGLADLVHPDDRAALRRNTLAALKGDARGIDIEHRMRTRSGEWKWIHSRGEIVLRGGDGRALRGIGISVDVTARKQAQAQLTHEATHDALTGLPNRALFFDRLGRAISRSERNRTLMAVLYLDVDRFKRINDRLGHVLGDALLKEFARRLAGCARATDTVARLGGDEFTMILEGLGGAQDGRRIAAKVIEAMRPEFTLDGRGIAVSTSLGIAFYGGGGKTTADELVKKADQALYEAKGAGRNRYHVAA